MAKRQKTKAQEEFEDSKGAIKSRKVKKVRQHNGQKKKGQWHKKSLKIPKGQSKAVK